MLPNIKIAVKIGSRLIERLRFSIPFDGGARRLRAAIDPQTPAMPGTQEPGNKDQLFGIEKLKGIAVHVSMKLLSPHCFQLS